MSKKVIVSGVTGQDGSYMVDYLLANTDHLIYGMVRRTSKPDLGNLKDALSNPRFKTVVGDLTDGASLDNLVKEIKPDYFINLAAQSFVGSSWTLPEQTFDVDAVGVIRCLEAIRKHVPHCRFYNAGSSEEHGSVLYTPQDIDHPPRARSPYGAAKVAARQIVKVYRESYGLYAIQGLLFNHESERRGEEFVTRKITLGVARIARAIKYGKPFEPIELGNLDAKRDWSHAEDFVDGIWRMLNQETHYTFRSNASLGSDQPNPPHSILKEYLLSSDETHTVREFIERAFAAVGITVYWSGTGVDERAYADCTPYLVRINPAFYRLADVELLLGDSTPARTELGWQPKVSFTQLVDRMVKSDLAAVGL
jgi:GDPmannose 4,6-dehydratase